MTSLGPAYIKLGQALSIRPDILSPAAMSELQKLCDKVNLLILIRRKKKYIFVIGSYTFLNLSSLVPFSNKFSVSSQKCVYIYLSWRYQCNKVALQYMYKPFRKWESEREGEVDIDYNQEKK